MFYCNFAAIFIAILPQMELKKIRNHTLSISYPGEWITATEVVQDEIGEVYNISFTDNTNEDRAVDLFYGPMPEGSDSYLEACNTYIESLDVDPENENIEVPVYEMDFRGGIAHGFDMEVAKGVDIRFLCHAVDDKLVTISICGVSPEDVDDLTAFVEEYLDLS